MRIRHFIRLVVGLLAALGLVLILLVSGVIEVSFLKTQTVSESTLILYKMEEIGNLELVRYNFYDVVREEIKRKLLDIDELAPDSKALLLIYGEAVACVDLKAVARSDIKIESDSIFLSLQEPKICFVKIDHNKSKVYDINFTARTLNPEIVNSAFNNAENLIEQEAIKSGILEEARTNAKKILSAFLSSLTEKNIVIKFKDAK